MIRYSALAIVFGIISASSFAQEMRTLTRDSTVLCRRVAQPPVIDGKLDDACWSAAAGVTDFILPKDGGKAKHRTDVYLVHDARGLYVGFRCAEPEMAKIKTGERYVWRNDSVEVYIDADRDRRGYFQLIADIAGGRFQQFSGIAGETPDHAWKADWGFAAARSEGEWTAEFFIPASTLGVQMREGTVIRANFARNEKGQPEASSWTKRAGNVTSALYFGNVIFGREFPKVNASLDSVTGAEPNSAVARLSLVNAGRSAATVSARVLVMPSRVGPVDLPKTSLGAGGTREIKADLRLPDDYIIGLDLWDRPASGGVPGFLGSYLVTRAPAVARAFGAVLCFKPWGTIWEASATCKVMPNAPIPAVQSKATAKTAPEPIQVFCARNEFEPFQIVLTPTRELKNVRASVSDLVGAGKITRDRVTVRLVETVPITKPTSPDCAPGDYPDPLVPFDSAAAPAGRNTALWFTIHVPSDAVPGAYRATVSIEADGIDPVPIPLSLRVWRFALPKLSFLRTAYACDYNAFCRWHGASSLEEKRKVAELVNQDFIDHRVCPINPLPFWGFDTERVGGKLSITFDEWDRGAELFLPRMNSFNLPGSFMSSVRQHRSGEPGYAEEKTEFLKLMAAHLKQKGWFEKGYNYIFDEPDPDRYADLVAEARVWREADPGFKILLTEQPEPELFGSVDIWTPVLDAYIGPKCRARQAAGDDIWWYVCMGPHHPYPNNFIDYPPIDQRILHWMNWKYRVSGVLYWQVSFWHGSPWENPMSRDDKDLGNGDGSLLYPAVRKPSATPLTVGPIDSIRWEMIREGIEDYDYLRMLSDAIESGVRRGADPKLIKAGRSALAEVDQLVRSLTDYEKDPRKLAATRIKIGSALDGLY